MGFGLALHYFMHKNLFGIVVPHFTCLAARFWYFCSLFLKLTTFTSVPKLVTVVKAGLHIRTIYNNFSAADGTKGLLKLIGAIPAPILDHILSTNVSFK